MNQYKSFSELKFLSRIQITGKYGVLIGAMLIEFVLSLLAINIIDYFIPPITVVNAILNYIVIFIVQLLTYVLEVGVCLLHLHVACEMPCRISDLLYGFKNNPDKALKIGFILAVINAICMIPSDIIQRDVQPFLSNLSYTSPENIHFEVYSVQASVSLVTCLCLFVYFIVTLSFFPAFYMILDFPEDSAVTILKRCFAVMRGNRWRYFLLNISFFPMIFISVFACGIPLLWMIPHMQVTFANFYLDLITNKPSQNTIEPLE